LQRLITSLVIQFREFYKNLSPARKWAVLLSLVLVFTTAAFLSLMLGKTNYVTFLKDVPGDQMPLIMTKLKERNIPFQIGGEGNTVLIPPEFIPTTQMAIMTDLGSANIGNLGFELFQKQDFGTTSYVQRINYQRALQGELMRAINTLDVIAKSKVILALPPKKTFLEESEKPKASVVLDILPGKSLTKDQVSGITYLVSSAVEGLSPDSVNVVDSKGRHLSDNKYDSDLNLSNDMLELKEKAERKLEERIESILGKVVGEGRVIARVSAKMDLRKITAIEQTVDPDKTAVLQTRTEEEKLNGNRTTPTGVAGARANIPGADEAGQVGFRQDVAKEAKVTQYEVPKTVRNITETPGQIEKLTVAVLVDGVTSVNTKDDGTVEEAWQPRPLEDIQKYEALVRNSIGFDEQRGDAIKIESMQFNQEDFRESEQLLSRLERRKLITYIFKWLVIGLSLAVFFFLVLRPFMKWVTESFQESVDDMLPKTIEELEELQSVDGSLPGMSAALPMIEDSIDPDKAESELLKDRIMSLVEKDNEKAANALSLWLVRKDF